jgi:hypothetical protein
MFSLIPALLQLVPELADLLGGGKAAEVVKIAGKVATQVIGDPGADAEGALQQIANNPALLEQFKARLDQETAHLKLQLEDIQDARATQLEMVKAGSVLAWAPTVLAFTVVLGFLSLTGAVMFKQIPESSTASILFGTLSTAFGLVLNYYFGSSRGSADKSGAINTIIGRLR